MGQRGPKPTPSAILNARGSWRGKANKAEPQPPAGVADAPAWLTPAARAVWAQLVPLMPAGVLTRVDELSLARYCDSFVRWRQAAAALDDHGSTYEVDGRNGKQHKLRPEVAEYHALAAMLVRLEQEFGLTPSSRTRIQVPDDQGKAKDDGKGRFFPRAAG